MDTAKKTTINSQEMDELNQILNLSDTASKVELAAAVRNIIADRDRLKGENTTLTTRIDELNQKAKDQRTAEAIALVDAAVKDGRINAEGKDAYIKLFDTDFDSAKTTLAAIPARQSVTGKINAGAQPNAVELADFTGKTWDELDRAGKLVVMKDKYPDLYNEKFEARFGIKPQKN